MKTPRTFFRTFLLLTLLLAAVGIFTNCVKQKNCEYGINGYFIYLENPYQLKYKEKDYKIKAFFIPNQNNLEIDSLTQVLLRQESTICHQELVYYIYGNIPCKYREDRNCPIPVYCSLKGFSGGPIYNIDNNKVLGIHIGTKKDTQKNKVGLFLKEVIEDIKNNNNPLYIENEKIAKEEIKTM